MPCRVVPIKAAAWVLLLLRQKVRARRDCLAVAFRRRLLCRVGPYTFWVHMPVRVHDDWCGALRPCRVSWMAVGGPPAVFRMRGPAHDHTGRGARGAPAVKRTRDADRPTGPPPRRRRQTCAVVEGSAGLVRLACQ
jgi:hypothetical protein